MKIILIKTSACTQCPQPATLSEAGSRASASGQHARRQLGDSRAVKTTPVNASLARSFLKLSTFQDGFQDGFPDGNLHILVEVPAGESFSSRPGRDVALTTPCNDSLIIHYRPVYPSLIVYHSLQSLPYRPTSTSTPSVCFVVLQRLSHGSLIIQFYSPNPQFHSMSCVIAATSFWVVRTRSEEEG